MLDTAIVRFIDNILDSLPAPVVLRDVRLVRDALADECGSYENEEREPRIPVLVSNATVYQATESCFLRRAATPSKLKPASIMA